MLQAVINKRSSPSVRQSARWTVAIAVHTSCHPSIASYSSPESFCQARSAFDATVRRVYVGILHDIWYGKTRMVWLVKNFWRYVYSFCQNSRTWQTDKQTDGWTLHDGTGRTCIASRGKYKCRCNHWKDVKRTKSIIVLWMWHIERRSENPWMQSSGYQVYYRNDFYHALAQQCRHTILI